LAVVTGLQLPDELREKVIRWCWLWFDIINHFIP